MNPIPADLQIDAGWLLRVQPQAPLRAHSVMVTDGIIVDVLPTADAGARYAPKRRADMTGHIVLPGLVNAHCHAAMSLMRGIADDLALQDWLQAHIWPREAAHVSAAFVFDGSLLAAAEMIRGGITACSDMYFFPDATARALRQSGMRVQLGLPVLEFPSAYAPDADGYLQRGLAVRDSLRDDPLISFALAPHAPYTVSDATFARIVTYAEELGLPIHTHLHETAGEVGDGIAAHGCRPLARLNGLGALGPAFMAIHAVHCNDEDLAVLVGHASHVVHCPQFESQAGQRGRADIGNAAPRNQCGAGNRWRRQQQPAGSVRGNAYRRAAGQRRHAGRHHPARSQGGGDGNAGWRAGAGTRGGNRVSRNREISRHDRRCVASPELSPIFDPYSHLVYSAGRADVSHAWVAGECILDNRQLTHCDLPAILRLAQHWQEKLK